MVVGIAAEKTGNPGTGQAVVEACTSDGIVNVVAVAVFQAVDRYSGAAGRPVSTVVAVAGPEPGKIQNYGPLSNSD